MNEINLGYELTVKLIDAVEAQRVALMDVRELIEEYQALLQKQAENMPIGGEDVEL